MTGDSASVTLRALSPDGQPVVATVRLYRVIKEQNQEVAYSETGTLQGYRGPGQLQSGQLYRRAAGSGADFFTVKAITKQ